MAHYESIIIGGGPAGLTAGLYLARAGYNAVLFESVFTGGQITGACRLENYPGFPQGIDGVSFGQLLHEQAEKAGLSIAYGEVTALQLAGPVKTVTVGNETHTADTVVLCMGAKPRNLGAQDEARFQGVGVSYCAICDGAFFRDKQVAVVGGGDTACEDAIYLANLAEQVYLIHRRDELRAQGCVAQRVRCNPKVQILWDTVVEGVQGEQRVEAVGLLNQRTQCRQDLPVDGVFVAVGIEPQTALVKGQLMLDDQRRIVTDKHRRTSLEGVYAAGDVRDTVLRQVVTAAADGAVAATAVAEYLAQRL